MIGRQSKFSDLIIVYVQIDLVIWFWGQFVDHFWHYFGSILGPCWVHVGTILEPNGGPGGTPGSDPYFWPYFGPSWGAFWSKLKALFKTSSKTTNTCCLNTSVEQETNLFWKIKHTPTQTFVEAKQVLFWTDEFFVWPINILWDIVLHFSYESQRVIARVVCGRAALQDIFLMKCQNCCNLLMS